MNNDELVIKSDAYNFVIQLKKLSLHINCILIAYLA